MQSFEKIYTSLNYISINLIELQVQKFVFMLKGFDMTDLHHPSGRNSNLNTDFGKERHEEDKK